MFFQIVFSDKSLPSYRSR